MGVKIAAWPQGQKRRGGKGHGGLALQGQLKVRWGRAQGRNTIRRGGLAGAGEGSQVRPLTKMAKVAGAEEGSLWWALQVRLTLRWCGLCLQQQMLKTRNSDEGLWIQMVSDFNKPNSTQLRKYIPHSTEVSDLRYRVIY